MSFAAFRNFTILVVLSIFIISTKQFQEHLENELNKADRNLFTPAHKSANQHDKQAVTEKLLKDSSNGDNTNSQDLKEIQFDFLHKDGDGLNQMNHFLLKIPIVSEEFDAKAEIDSLRGEYPIRENKYLSQQREENRVNVNEMSSDQKNISQLNKFENLVTKNNETDPPNKNESEIKIIMNEMDTTLTQSEDPLLTSIMLDDSYLEDKHLNIEWTNQKDLDETNSLNQMKNLTDINKLNSSTSNEEVLSLKQSTTNIIYDKHDKNTRETCHQDVVVVIDSEFQSDFSTEIPTETDEFIKGINPPKILYRAIIVEAIPSDYMIENQMKLRKKRNLQSLLDTDVDLINREEEKFALINDQSKMLKALVGKHVQPLTRRPLDNSATTKRPTKSLLRRRRSRRPRRRQNRPQKRRRRLRSTTPISSNLKSIAQRKDSKSAPTRASNRKNAELSEPEQKSDDIKVRKKREIMHRDETKKRVKRSISDDEDELEDDEDDEEHKVHLSEKHERNTLTKTAKKWDRWQRWGPCSVTCGVGKMTRWRHCVSGGCAPGEKEAQIKTCSLPAC